MNAEIRYADGLDLTCGEEGFHFFPCVDDGGVFVWGKDSASRWVFGLGPVHEVEVDVSQTEGCEGGLEGGGDGAVVSPAA